MNYRSFEIIKEDSGYADAPHRYLGHQSDGEVVRHWGATIDEVKQSIDEEYERIHDEGKDCGVDGCQTCCSHDERDHGICLDCGDEEDPGAAIDRAMDAFEDR